MPKSGGQGTAREARLALVNGVARALILQDDRLVLVMSFTVVRGRVVEIEILSDPHRLPAV